MRRIDINTLATFKRYRSISACLALALLILLVLPVHEYGILNANDKQQFESGKKGENSHPALELHDPISINGDAEFVLTAQSEGWAGNGSLEDPYLIENLFIDVNGLSIDCINIASVDFYFVIHGCFLRGANVTDRAGIYLFDVYHATVTDNDCRRNYNGIYLTAGAGDSVIMNNTCNGNIWAGIRLATLSVSIAATNNTCVGNANGIEAFGSFSLERNTCTDNSQNGILISMNPANTAYNIFNNSLFRNDYGVYDDGNIFSIATIDARWNLIGNNTINAVSLSEGIWDFNFWSDYTGNDTDYNGIGDTPYSFSSKQDNHPMMMPQWAAPPTRIDVELGVELTTDMTVYLWHFWLLQHWWSNDTTDVMISGSGVIKNATTLQIGIIPLEIWVNDTLGHTARTIVQVEVLDITPPEWIICPKDQHLVLGDDLAFEIAAWDMSEISDCSINDTEHFVLFWWKTENYRPTCFGWIRNITSLQIGTYNLLIQVRDQYLNSLNASLKVIVNPPYTDDTPPVWVIEPSYQTIEYGAQLNLQFAAWDESGINAWFINDTVRFDISTAGKLSSVIPLTVGQYGLSVSVADVFNNSISSEFVIEVVDTTSPIWIVFPSDQWLEEGNEFRYALVASDMSGIDHWTIDDTVHFSISEAGLVMNATDLQKGVYQLHISAYDPYGWACSAVFRVHVSSAEFVFTIPVTSDPLVPVYYGTAGAIGFTAGILGLILFRKLKTRRSS
jgi:parallel beta-helix repeat protein